MDSKTYFDRVSGAWDAMRAGFFSETVRDRALEAAGLKPGNRAADVGAGTGFLTEGLVRLGVKVVAVDPSEEMLKVLEGKGFDAQQVEGRPGEADRLPLENAAVDAVLANMALHHVEDPPAAIREMTRILKPGGRLVITDLDAHGFTFLREEHKDRWMGFDRRDVAGWFQEAGFDHVRVEDVGEKCCASSCCGSESAAVSIFMAVGTKPGGPERSFGMEEVSRRGAELFGSGLYCAESVLQAVAEHLGVSSPLIPRIATGFCGGMARTSDLCGAFTGGVMALGLACGRDRAGEKIREAYDRTARFAKAFEERFGSCRCSELLGCDLGTKEGYARFKEEDLATRVCKVVTGEAAGLAAEIANA